jgi:hypothetical protein
MITPLGNIRLTCSASELDAMRLTRGFRTGFGALVGRGLGALLAVTIGLGSHGIQVALRVALTRGRGVAELVAPGRPFRIEIVTWFSSSALTSIQVSPSQRSAPWLGAEFVARNIEVRTRTNAVRIAIGER